MLTAEGVMVREKFPVRLTPEERDQAHLVRAGRSLVAARARILLKTDEGWSALGCG